MAFPKGSARKGETAKQPRPGVPLSKEIMLKLIKESNGNLSRVADAMGTTRYTIRDRCDKDAELMTALKDARERQIDALEASVFDRAVDSNDTTLQLFVLKTQGKHRGWEQNEMVNSAKDIATAAFQFIQDRSKNPAEHSR